jgi:hypothetical protein
LTGDKLADHKDGDGLKRPSSKPRETTVPSRNQFFAETLEMVAEGAANRAGTTRMNVSDLRDFLARVMAI